MPLAETDLARIRRWVDARNSRIPATARHQIRHEMDVAGRSVTIVQCRAPWHPGFGLEWTRLPIARLRYTAARREWRLYWRDRNEKFHVYQLTEPTPNVESLLAEIDADRIHIFWG